MGSWMGGIINGLTQKPTTTKPLTKKRDENQPKDRSKVGSFFNSELHALQLF
jgi:hypothetical protein